MKVICKSEGTENDYFIGMQKWPNRAEFEDFKQLVALVLKTMERSVVSQEAKASSVAGNEAPGQEVNEDSVAEIVRGFAMHK